MSDRSISIVPKISSYPNNKIKAIEILDWLVSLDVVKPTLSDCILSSENGYAISEGAKDVSLFPNDLPFDLVTNGLEIVTRRNGYFDYPEEIICPSCKMDIGLENLDIGNWKEYFGDGMTCSFCGISSDLNLYKFTPEAIFSDLAFCFWNWPDFEKDFIDKIKQKLDCEIVISYNRF